jgi:hypothetical protein
MTLAPKLSPRQGHSRDYSGWNATVIVAMTLLGDRVDRNLPANEHPIPPRKP